MQIGDVTGARRIGGLVSGLLLVASAFVLQAKDGEYRRELVASAFADVTGRATTMAREQRHVQVEVQSNGDAEVQVARTDFGGTAATTAAEVQEKTEWFYGADLTNLSLEFADTALTYGKIIISEAALPLHQKTIKPAMLGGVAGGDKFVVHGILFKFACDSLVSTNPPIWLYGGSADTVVKPSARDTGTVTG